MPFRRKSHYIYGLAWLAAQLEAVCGGVGEGKVQESKRNDVDKLRNYCASLANAAVVVVAVAIAVAFDFPQLNSISFTIKFRWHHHHRHRQAGNDPRTRTQSESRDSNSNSVWNSIQLN